MVSILTKRITSFTMLAFSCFFLLSCVSTMGCVGCDSSASKIQKPWSLKPQESFGLVLVTVNMKPDSCEWTVPISGAKPCRVESLNLLPKDAKSVGSSIVVGHHNDDNKTYWLSASHVCSEKPTSQFIYTTSDGFQATVHVKKTVSDIRITDYSGNVIEANVYRQDVPNDLCLLSSQGIVGKPFRVSPNDPGIGEKTYNVAAPHKIWAPGMVLMLDGYYSGKSPDGFHHYTIPARPGSSGSPIFDEHGRIVGVIQRAVINFENLAISTSTQAIREIVNTIPRDAPKIDSPTKIEVLKL